ncbi:serine/threonine protein kinase [Akkermansia sp.]|uniref:serine/threonine protein kinase n=1 Tax=Akkermansia sp. TaxID=1872421 RepID=UPI0039940D73
MEDASPLPCCHLPEGTLLGSYEIKGILGQGGFGISYWAIDWQLGREVVLKEHYPTGLCKRDADRADVNPVDSSQESNYNRSLNSFCKEARIIAALDHPGIVRIHDIFQALGTAYIVMAFVEGCSLDQWLDEHAQDAPQIQKLLISLLDTLSYLHSQEVFHRDIKPSNIMVKEDGSPVLLDFGAALEGLPTETMTVMASPDFSPPEQYSGHGNMGPWSDLFALGRSFISVLGNKLDSYPKVFVESLKKATRLDIEDRL